MAHDNFSLLRATQPKYPSADVPLAKAGLPLVALGTLAALASIMGAQWHLHHRDCILH